MHTVLLNQNQCEAVADILVLAMCVDDKFSLVEEEAMQKEITLLGWNSMPSLATHWQLSYRQARSVIHFPEQRRSYLEQLAEKLATPEAKNLVLEKALIWLSSHRLTREEGAFIKQLRGVFGFNQKAESAA